MSDIPTSHPVVLHNMGDLLSDADVFIDGTGLDHTSFRLDSHKHLDERLEEQKICVKQ